MNKILIIMGIFLLVIFNNILGQLTRSISKPRLSIEIDKLKIEYDIVSKNPSENYIVWLNMYDASNKPIKSGTFQGDFGRNIKVGNNKQIYWEPDQTWNLTYRGDINVTVHAIHQKRYDNFEFIPTDIKKSKTTYSIHTFFNAFASLSNLYLGFKVKDLHNDIVNIDVSAPAKFQELMDKRDKLDKTALALLIGTGVSWVASGFAFIGTNYDIQKESMPIKNKYSGWMELAGILGMSVGYYGLSMTDEVEGHDAEQYKYLVEKDGSESEWAQQYYFAAAISFGAELIMKLIETTLISQTFKNLDLNTLDLSPVIDPLSGTKMIFIRKNF